MIARCQLVLVGLVPPAVKYAKRYAERREACPVTLRKIERRMVT